jgi:universal stress protein A
LRCSLGKKERVVAKPRKALLFEQCSHPFVKAIATPRSRASSKSIVRKRRRKATAAVPSEASVVPHRLRLTRILVPTDFSEHSRKALSYALGLALQYKAEVTLLHVLEPIVYPADWMLPLMTSDAPEVRKFLAEQLKSLARKSPGAAQPIIRFGIAWQEIVATAKKQKTDLIVIGTHGYSGVKHALLGSVAERVVRHAPCPIFIVRPDERDFL